MMAVAARLAHAAAWGWQRWQGSVKCYLLTRFPQHPV